MNEIERTKYFTLGIGIIGWHAGMQLKAILLSVFKHLFIVLGFSPLTNILFAEFTNVLLFILLAIFLFMLLKKGRLNTSILIILFLSYISSLILGYFLSDILSLFRGVSFEKDVKIYNEYFLSNILFSYLHSIVDFGLMSGLFIFYFRFREK